MIFTSKHRFIGAEFDWLAIDRANRMALFATAGAGAIPSLLDSAEHESANSTTILALPRICDGAEVVNAPGEHGEWVDVARRGVYAYDWSRRDEAYILIARPTRPAIITEHLCRSAIRLDIDFATCERFRPESQCNGTT
jgi:hypothetical protein